MNPVTPTTIPTIMTVLFLEATGVVSVLVFVFVLVFVLVFLLVLVPSEVLTLSVTAELATSTVHRPAEDNKPLKEPELIACASFAFKSTSAVLVALSSADVLDVMEIDSGSISDMILTESLVTPTTLTLEVSVMPNTAHIRSIPLSG